MNHVEIPSMKQRLCAAITAGALVVSIAGAPATALAETVEPSSGAPSGTGATSVTVQLADNASDIGGSEDTRGNPGGANIAFTVPTAINFVAKANGELIGPKPGATYIENGSAFAIHASSMMVEADDKWNLVEDVSAADADKPNSIDFTFGPESDPLNAARYEDSKTAIVNKDKWEMSYALAGDSDTADRVLLVTKGHIARVDNDIKQQTKVASIHTYVTQGKAASA